MISLRRALSPALVSLLFGLTQLPTASADTLPGRCLSFDGRDDLVRVPHSKTLDEPKVVTLESWIFAEDANEGGVAGMWGDGGFPDRYLLSFDSGHLVARIELAGGGVFSVSHATPVAAWFHGAMTYDGTDLTLYLNGTAVGSTIAVGSLGPNDGDFIMGREEIILGSESYFRGRLDEVRLWRLVRTPAQMAHFYNQKLLADEPGLIGSWSFQAAVGEQVVKDSSPVGNDGTLGFDAAVDIDDPSRVPSDAPMRWENLGLPLAGTPGEPLFTAEGTLIGGSIASFNLSNAYRDTRAVLVVGGSAVYLPFEGGTMVPSPDFLFFGSTDSAGEIDFDVIWPGGILPCTNLYMQWWIKDPGGPSGWAASNGLRLETP